MRHETRIIATAGALIIAFALVAIILFPVPVKRAFLRKVPIGVNGIG
jgi:hypothetical protein